MPGCDPLGLHRPQCLPSVGGPKRSGGSLLEAMSPMKGGVLSTPTSTPTRHAIALGAVVAMIVLPLLLLGASSPTPASAGRTEASSAANQAHGHQQRHLRRIMLVGNRIPVPTTSTTTTTAPPAPTPASGEAAAPTPTTAVRVATPTPTTAAPAPTTTRPMSSSSGLATWYAWRTGQCASPTLPMGTTVVVRNVATGATASCLVTDREASNPGRVIDLDTSVFQAIAPLSAGAVSVIISW